MSTRVIYNGSDLPSPTPFVTKTVENIFYGERWGSRDIVTIRGSITGCNFDDLISEQSGLLNIFHENFKTFSVVDGDTAYEAPVSFVESINFDSNNYVGLVPYTIQLYCYPEHTFSIFHGVTEPQDSWAFNEQEGQIVEIEHTVSAQGFNTTGLNSSAFSKAIEFVQTRTGTANAPSPEFIGDFGTENLITVRESLNRLNGTYSITETYHADLASTGYGILRYTADVQSGIEGFIRLSLKGGIYGGINSSRDAIRDRYQELDFAEIATGFYGDVYVEDALNITPLSSGIIEFPLANKLDFNLLFDNNPNEFVNLDYSSQIKTEDDITEISINGNVNGRGDLSGRWDRVQEYYNNEVNVYDIASGDYDTYKEGEDKYEVNPAFLTSGVSFNKFDGTISFNVSFDDKDPPPEGLDSFDYTLDMNPSIRVIQSTALNAANDYPDQYYVLDMGYYKRASFAINGRAKLSDNVFISQGKQIIIREINALFLKHGKKNSVIENQEMISNPEFGREISFTFGWTFDGNVVNVEDYYERVLNLKV